MNKDLGAEIAAATVMYASLVDPVSRMTARAQVLGLIEKLALSAAPLDIRRVSEDEVRQNVALRGAMVLHVDFASRVALDPDELVFTAATGRILIAEHPDLAGFPVGLTLLLPSDSLPHGRQQLFSEKGEGWGASEFVVQYSLSTNPAHIGAGRALVEAARREAGTKRFIAYTPLTGLRARIIQIVDHEATWRDMSRSLSEEARADLRFQLTELLGRDTLPTDVVEPLLSFLPREARAFAADSRFSLGEFHRHLGAKLIGVDDAGDQKESDSMWARAYLEYPSDRKRNE